MAADPEHKRTTLRTLASETKIMRSTLQYALERGSIVRRRSTLNPLVTAANNLERIRFASSFVRHVPTKMNTYSIQCVT